MRHSFLLYPLLLPALAAAQDAAPDSARTFQLGEVTAIGVRPKRNIAVLDGEYMRRHKVDRAEQALELLPGVVVRDAGAKNEGSFYLRGFDQRRVPVYLDGVPIYMPFEGTLDLRRLLTSGLDRVEVQKGVSSLMLGPGAMGGAVNLVSRRPVRLLEVDAEVATSWDACLSVGSRLEKFYFQLDGSLLDRDYVRLPHSFKLTEAQPTRHLDNSDTRDWQLSARAAFTPNATDEYAVAYHMSRARKGVPVYLGAHGGMARWWRYPKWDKDEVLFHSSARLTPGGDLVTRLFYDKFYNVIKSYDDDSYGTQEGKKAFTSTYDDYTVGGFVGWNQSFGPADRLSVGANFKTDVHRSHDKGEPAARKADNVWNVGAENLWTPVAGLEAMAGVGLSGRNGTEARNYERPPGSKDNQLVSYPLTHDVDFNYQASVKYWLAPRHNVKLSFARTSRFPTLSERYSYKMGKAYPNPDLRTERACNLDLTVAGAWRGLRWEVSGYYSWLSDVIMEITGVDPDNPTVWQLQNRGRAQFRGFEVNLSQSLPLGLTLAGSYSYLNRVNKTEPNVKFTDVPSSKGIVSLDWQLPLDFGLNADMTAYSSALSTSDGSLSVPGFAVFNATASKQFMKRMVTVRAGVKNIFDKLYYYTEGYPQQGRVFFASVAVNWSL